MRRVAVIQKCRKEDREPGKPWCLYSKNKSKLLGRHKTKSDAETQERAIQVSKHGRLSVLFDEVFCLIDGP